MLIGPVKEVWWDADSVRVEVINYFLKIDFSTEVIPRTLRKKWCRKQEVIVRCEFFLQEPFLQIVNKMFGGGGG